MTKSAGVYAPRAGDLGGVQPGVASRRDSERARRVFNVAMGVILAGSVVLFIR